LPRHLRTIRAANILVKARTIARAKAAARPAIMAAKARTLAKARAAALPTVQSHPSWLLNFILGLAFRFTKSSLLLPGRDREVSMPANRFNGFTDYGVGIGLRIPHYRHILERKPVVDWFEIISENYMVDGGRPLTILDRILEQYRVVQHGVSMYFGSAEPLNREHLRRLKNLARRTRTPWLSDHLCWGSVDGRYTHDLLPMPYTFEAASVTAEKIRQVQDFVEVPVVVENVSSYAEYHVSEMTEWEFLMEVVERADCGILLDVNNIYVSSQNHDFDPFTYVNAVPAERVAQIHIAGHSKYEKYILDTHDHPVIDPVWDLYARAIERCGPTATLLEWDDNIPSFDEVHAEALKANRYLAKRAPFPHKAVHSPEGLHLSPEVR
jgi:uncharacterized protein